MTNPYKKGFNLKKHIFLKKITLIIQGFCFYLIYFTNLPYKNRGLF